MMKILISGGCKNGKSHYAQRLILAQRTGGLFYVATMIPADSEDAERIKRHRKSREGQGFITVEQPRRIEGILDRCDHGGSFLLDSLTALLANEMFAQGGGMNENAAREITAGLSRILRHIGNIVIVSDYIYGDASFFSPSTEGYRKSLAEIDREAARLCDVVLEASFTSIIVHKGGEAFDAIRQKMV